MAGQSTSMKVYVLVAVALFALLGLTIGAAYMPLGALGPVVALLIAFAKAAVVAVFFMHLNQGTGIQRLYAGAGVLWLVFLIGLSLTDFLTR